MHSTDPRNTLPGTRAGFTLAELIFTLVIVGIALLIALGSRPTSAASEADRAAILLQRQLQLARTESITRGQPSRVAFESDRTYSRWTVDSAGIEAKADVVQLPDELVFGTGLADRGPMGDASPPAYPASAFECDMSGSCGAGVAPVSAVYITSVRDPKVVRAVVQSRMGTASMYRYDHATGAWQ